MANEWPPKHAKRLVEAYRTQGNPLDRLNGTVYVASTATLPQRVDLTLKPGFDIDDETPDKWADIPRPFVAKAVIVNLYHPGHEPQDRALVNAIIESRRIAQKYAVDNGLAGSDVATLTVPFVPNGKDQRPLSLPDIQSAAESGGDHVASWVDSKKQAKIKLKRLYDLGVFDGVPKGEGVFDGVPKGDVRRVFQTPINKTTLAPNERA